MAEVGEVKGEAKEVKKIATRTAYGKALVELGKVNPNVVVLDADLAKSTKSGDFMKAFPDRFFEMGIAEQDMIGTAAGLAAAGKIPFASTFAVFAAGRVFDQVRQAVGYTKLNVKIGATHAGVTVGEDGASHQSVEDIALMRSIPNMTVIVPADAVETQKAVFAAAEYYGPVYLRMGREEVPVLFDEDYRFEIGKAVMLRDGKDVTIIACGVMVAPALEASEELSREGISARVLNMHTVKPIDREAIETAAKETGAIVTAEEHNIMGGFGSAVAEVVVSTLPVPVEMVGIKDVFGQSGKPAELLEYYGLTSGNIVEAARRAIARKAGKASPARSRRSRRQ
ncbi:MAG TPA: transketolase family protein [Firmicutes bacterium]|nr:transketolase family protein [Bacillota bacterium]